MHRFAAMPQYAFFQLQQWFAAQRTVLSGGSACALQ
jgi:hypothetical protein